MSDHTRLPQATFSPAHPECAETHSFPVDAPFISLTRPLQARSVDARSRPSGVQIDAPFPKRISVVMPVLNEERLLPDTLAHTAALGFDELIVVDGGSRDRTREIVHAFQLGPRHSAFSTVKLLTAPRGRACQMNAGAAASRGEVLLFLHADTRLPADAARMIGCALEDGACTGGRFDVRFDPDSGWRWVISRMMNVRSRWTGVATGDQAIFVQRPVFERLRGFSEIPLMEDIEFSRRLKRMGRMAALRAPVVTSYRRWQTGGPLRTILLMWLLRSLYWLGISPRALSHLYGDAR